jgi:hypothetical protein
VDLPQEYRAGTLPLFRYQLSHDVAHPDYYWTRLNAIGERRNTNTHLSAVLMMAGYDVRHDGAARRASPRNSGAGSMRDRWAAFGWPNRGTTA